LSYGWTFFNSIYSIPSKPKTPPIKLLRIHWKSALKIDENNPTNQLPFFPWNFTRVKLSRPSCSTSSVLRSAPKTSLADHDRRTTSPTRRTRRPKLLATKFPNHPLDTRIKKKFLIWQLFSGGEVLREIPRCDLYHFYSPSSHIWIRGGGPSRIRRRAQNRLEGNPVCHSVRLHSASKIPIGDFWNYGPIKPALKTTL